ncbi:MAG: GGDEF domain-containing protein [Phycisphaerales bacterium]|nr:GGDEF domain-containing protein [Phycisphaerales bacterium]
MSGAAAELEVRVILVGRTGLDAKLRLDPGLELVRVRTPLEAIGELSDPIDEQSPRACVVIFGDDSQDDPDPRDAVLKGLRLVDPAVGVVGLSTCHVSAESEFDAVVPADAPAELVRTLVRDVAKLRRPRSGPPVSSTLSSDSSATLSGPAEPMTPVVVTTTPPRPFEAEPPGEPASGVGDDVLVGLLLRGRDITEAAVRLLRERSGDPTVEFIPASAPESAATTGTPVRWEGRTLGLLRSAAGTGAGGSLSIQAAWLAGWLRLRDQQEQLREAAFTDSLTGAWNRRYFERFLHAAIEQARLHRRSVTVLFFDIDDFKQFNDRHGHEAGDEILTETIKLLRSVVRPTDRVCRIGGDEFAVIFFEPEGPRHSTSKHPTDVCQIAHRFQEQIRAHRFPKLGQGAPGPLTISGGLATYPWDGSTVEELMRKADELSLTCKRQGKNAIMLGPEAGAV